MIAGQSGKMPGRGGMLPTCCAPPAPNRGSLEVEELAGNPLALAGAKSRERGTRAPSLKMAPLVHEIS
jgi:hypothetical protein